MQSRFIPTAGARRAGFTLIELLTVIAIIGILAAILIPTVAKVRESARQSQAISNLRQAAMGCITYANDNKGRYPAFGQRTGTVGGTALGSSGGTGTANGWWDDVQAYLQNLPNPNFPLPRRDPIFNDPTVQSRIPSDLSFQIHWGANPLLMNDDPNYPNDRLTRYGYQDKVRNPSEVILLADAQLQTSGYFAAGALWNVGGGWWNAPISGWWGGDPEGLIATNDQEFGNGDIAYRANGGNGAKCAFADGHVSIMTKGTIKGRNIEPAN